MLTPEPLPCPVCGVNEEGSGPCAGDEQVQKYSEEPQPVIHCPCCDACRKKCKEEA